MAPRHRSSFDSFPSGESSRRSNTPRRTEDASRPQVSAARSYSRAAYGDTGARQRAASFSRDSTQAEYARIRAKKKRRKIIGGVIGALFAVLLVGGGAALAYMGILNGKLSFGIDDETRGALVDKSLSEPFYMLLMGTDKSEDRDASGEFGDAYRSDSMMLARIDPQQKKVTLVSIERDTLVDIDGYGINKINAAYALGGPSLAVKTVSEFAGVPISHYAEINFDGFKAVVDALGGVDVNVSIDIDDPEAGGSLSAGEQTINGDQALILCRSRHDLPSHSSAAGEEDHIVGAGCFGSGNLRAAGDGPAEASFEADIQHFLQDSSRSGSVFRRFERDAVAGGDGRDHRPHCQQEGIVPGSDDEADAPGLPDNPAAAGEVHQRGGDTLGS